MCRRSGLLDSALPRRPPMSPHHLWLRPSDSIVHLSSPLRMGAMVRGRRRRSTRRGHDVRLEVHQEEGAAQARLDTSQVASGRLKARRLAQEAHLVRREGVRRQEEGRRPSRRLESRTVTSRLLGKALHLVHRREEMVEYRGLSKTRTSRASGRRLFPLGTDESQQKHTGTYGPPLHQYASS